MTRTSTQRCPIMTTSAGAPVVDNQNSLSAGPRGPLLMQDWQLLEKLAHQNRERIPERVVHAKGWGAFGTFTVTHDITLHLCQPLCRSGQGHPAGHAFLHRRRRDGGSRRRT